MSSISSRIRALQGENSSQGERRRSSVDRFVELVDIGSSFLGTGQADSRPTVQSTPRPERQTVALVPVPVIGLRASWSHG